MNTIAELISSRANDEQTALLFDEQRWSYREFVEDCAQRAAYLLDARDQSKPFHIAVLLDNVPEYPLWLGACALAGAKAAVDRASTAVEMKKRDVCMVLPFLKTDPQYPVVHFYAAIPCAPCP